MSGLPSLTAGAIPALRQDKAMPNPVLQVINIGVRQDGAGGGGESTRYRLVVSDGQYYMYAMVSSQLNTLVADGTINTNCIISVHDYMVNNISNNMVLVILNATALNSNVPEQIGNPQNVSEMFSGQPQQAPVPQQQAYRQPPQYAQPSAQTRPQPGPQSSFSGSASGYNNSSSGVRNESRPQSSYGGGASGYGHGPVPSNPHRANIIEIANLNPYISSWTIKARVTSKSNIRTWSNARGDGKLFSVDLLDSAGGEIRATMFNETADKFFDVLHEGQIYLITKGQLKVANRQFTHLKSDYEITLNRDTEITPVQDDQSIQHQLFEFRQIMSLPEIEKDQYVDVIGVVTHVSPIGTVTSRATQREIPKRTITLVDLSDTAVELTLWGKEAENNSEDQLAGNPIVAIKGARVSDFGGRSLSTVMSSQIVWQPDIPEAHKLRAWFDQRGVSSSVKTLSRSGGGTYGNAEAKTCAAIKEENLGLRDPSKPDVFSLVATVSVLQFNQERPQWYLSCPSGDCKKKVNETNAGQWHCEKCNKSYPTCLPRYILSFVVADSTGSQWISAFNDVCETVLQGRKAEEMRRLFESGDITTVQAAFRNSNFGEFTFVVRAKADSMEDSLRLRCTALSASPVNYKEECRKALEIIQSCV